MGESTMTRQNEDRDVSAKDVVGGLSAEGLSEARKFLRDLQAQNPTTGGVSRIALEQSTMGSALAQLSKRRSFQRTADPRLVVRDGLKFNPELEEKRIALAEDLIRRVDPGPFEDPVYLSLLAYQAASIEMALLDRSDGKQIDWGWSRFLLGTIHCPETNAFAQKFDSHGHVVVVLHSGLIEFAYQAAKAVVAAQNPMRTTVGRGFVTTDSSAEHIVAELARNQRPVERLYRTLEAYFFAGYPRAFTNEVVPVEHLLPLGFLIDMTERWIIAHEYGHGLATRIDWKRAPESPNRAEEYFADENATIQTAMSAARCDVVPPEFGLIGGLFSLACLEVVRRGLSVVCHGVIDADQGDDEHPPNQMRAENILRAFNVLIDVRETATGVDVGLKLQPGLDLNPAETDATRLRRARVFQYPNALFAIWDRVLPRLRKDFESGRPLHRMWR
jgi:hypothetical protein